MDDSEYCGMNNMLSAIPILINTRYMKYTHDNIKINTKVLYMGVIKPKKLFELKHRLHKMTYFDKE